MNKFKIFHQLHNDILLLPNAWDPLSALLLEQAGFAAIATTSWGMAQARGQQDGEQCSFAEFLNQLKPIVNAVSIPISVDIESGYSNDINTICQHVLAVTKLGAVGINIEDSDKKTGKLRTQKQQIAYLLKACSAFRWEIAYLMRQNTLF
ncbi:isocitrate lyase/PEP mutase family protein [Pseudoalteromonas haloplanktis]|uniref:Isocitrate lyase/PEP mutase family protein n=1 Tax=Pseudoalteromonas haloplanktis TaxID=228 RepID=A0ABU1BK92_PSEHA|nr:isocitrate lyase/PEP mutase family protein [Pseudoalteromonas haloplanktis]MDQ9093929.1 isocitrate lyase/PEP mutase family protein [Pseudoalteromonas haloplanktis]